jgi:hypothetical protein
VYWEIAPKSHKLTFLRHPEAVKLKGLFFWFFWFKKWDS